MSKFSWLHFSDLHFTTVAGVEQNDAREKMYELLKTIDECEYVFITGDVAHRGNYSAVTEHIGKLAQNIVYDENRPSERKEQFFWAVGNHDIERVDERTNLIREIRKSKDILLSYDEAMCNPATKLWLGQLGYDNYFDATKQLSRDKSIRANMGRLGSHNQELHRIVELPEVNLIILNSCLLACDDDDTGNLFALDGPFDKDFKRIFNDAAVEKMRKSKKPTFVLAHHGKEYLHKEEYRRLVEKFAGKVDLYLCGHSHELFYQKFYDPEVDATESSPENVIHQYTCGMGTLNGEDSKMSFIYGQYESGKIKITTYFYENGKWVSYSGDKVRSNIEIQRFKREYRLKMNNFKLYVTGAQGAGKTAITKQLLNILQNTEALQIAEVDFIKDALREDIEIKENRFKEMLEGVSEEGFKKTLLDLSEYVLGEKDYREAMLATSCSHTIEHLERQSDYIFPRLMNAVDRHTEKGIPAIIEGLNIPMEQLIQHYKNLECNDGFNFDSIMIVNLFIDSIENHEVRMKQRIADRQLEADEAKKQLLHLENLFRINTHYKEIAQRMKSENPNIRICNIANSGVKDRYTVAMEIVDFITESGNFVE